MHHVTVLTAILVRATQPLDMTYPHLLLQGTLAIGLLLGLPAAWAAGPAGGLNLSLPPEEPVASPSEKTADALPPENGPKPYRRGIFERTRAEELPYGVGYEARQQQYGGGMSGRGGGRGAGRGR